MVSKTHLDENQQRVLARIASDSVANVFILWWAMGSGKTRIALFAFEQSGYNDLIVICRRVSFSDWIEEMLKVGLNFTVFQDTYSPKNIINLGDSKSKRMLLISHGSIHKLPENFPKGEMLVVDELYLFSNAKAQRSKQLHKMSLFCSARLGLSGTIMPARDNLTIFGQFAALNAERVLASGSTEFKSKFQNRTKGKYGMQFANKPGSEKKISQLVAPYVDIYKQEKRPTVVQIIQVASTPQQRELYREVKELYQIRKREFKHAVQTIPVLFGISNGWVKNDIGANINLECPKIDRLAMILEELHSQGSKAVIWAGMHSDLYRIAEEFDGYFSFCRFTGADYDFDLKGWEKGKYDFCLATVANGASVNHFRNVKYAIYYSINFKWLDLEQSMMRHERKSSEHNGAHYYFLQTKGTLDARAHYLVMQSKKEEQDIIRILQQEI